MRATTALLILLPELALAQGLRDGDRVPSAEELATTLGGATVTFHDGSAASYGADGGYSYRYTPQDPAFVGQYETAAEGQVCVSFDNGSGRCDTYVESGGRLVLITADGLRFPVRGIGPIAD